MKEQITETTLEEYEKEEKINHEKISPLLQKETIIVIPQELNGEYLLTYETMCLLKELRTKSIDVEILKNEDKPVNVADLRSADLSLDLGVIVGTALLQTILQFVGQYIYDTFFDPEKEKNPIMRVKYYDYKKKVKIEVEGPASKFNKFQWPTKK